MPGGNPAQQAAAVQVDSHHLEGEKKNRLVVNLARKALGRVALAVQLQKDLQEANLLTPTGKASDIPLPIPQVAAGTVERATGRLLIYAPESLRVNPGKTEGLRSISFQEALEGMAAAPRPSAAQGRPVLAFAFTQEPTTLRLAAERQKPQVIIRQMLVVRVEQGMVKYQATFHYTILYSGVKSLRIDVPAELAALGLQNNTPAIRDKVMDPRPDGLAKGYAAWSFSGESELIGAGDIELVWQKKLDNLALGKPVELRRAQADPAASAGRQSCLGTDRADQGRIARRSAVGRVEGLAADRPAARSGGPGQRRRLGLSNSTTIGACPPPSLDTRRRKSSRPASTGPWCGWSLLRPTRLPYRRSIGCKASSNALPSTCRARPSSTPSRCGSPASRCNCKGSTGNTPCRCWRATRTSPSCWNCDTRSPSTETRLELPTFPEGAAVQKVYLCVYLPATQALLGSVGPWSQESSGPSKMSPGGESSALGDDALISWVQEGTVSAGKAAGSFLPDGTRYLFSAIRPAAPPAGSLQLHAFNERGLARSYSWP